jgi:hypothetical protein
MITLGNNELDIDIIDPRNAAERPRLGCRFAHGGLVWQVRDREAGALLSGPEWPEHNPSPFNAQGLAESFRHRTRDLKPCTWRDGVGVAIGCGRIAKASGGGVVMTGACRWEIETRGDAVFFSTGDVFAGFDYALVRVVRLSGRVLTLESRLTNRGAAALVLEWFAHPFFEYTDGGMCACLPREVGMAENPGFVMSDGMLRLKRRFCGVSDGHMEVVPWPGGVKCVFTVDHPRLSGIKNELMGVEPFECVIWGNGNTFSIEPYVRLELAPGQTRIFSMRHAFGGVGGWGGGKF